MAPDGHLVDLSSSEPLDLLTLVDLSPWETLPDAKWRKFNWDTGCATTVFPREEFPELDSAKDQIPCRTASGEVVMASSRIAVKGSDERGKPRRIKGKLAPVHKTLVSAGEVAVQGYDGWVGSDGGYLMPRNELEHTQY